MDTIQCHTCRTTFTMDRLGLTQLLENPKIDLSVAVKCPVCHSEIHARVESEEVERRLIRSPWKKTPVRTTRISIARHRT